MRDDVKALIVVLGIAIPILIAIRPICLRFMSAEVYARRRNAWIILTSVAFLAPSFWAYALFAIPYLAWLGVKDDNPVALYLLLAHVIPPYPFDIPVVGINQLFELTNYRLLALVLFVPWLWRNAASREPGITVIGLFLLMYFAIKLVPMIPYETATSTVRRAALFWLDSAVLYLVAARVCNSKQKIVDVMATFCIVCAMLAVLSAFESLKTWALYAGIGQKWGLNTSGTYLFREGALRSSVSTGHALGLGYFMGIGFGFWLYLSSSIKSWTVRGLGYGWMWVGLLAAYSRAPWLMTVLLLFLYLLLSPGGTTRFMKAVGIAAIVGVGALMTPLGEKLINTLPFIGTVESENVIYRQQLAEATWKLLKLNPLFGDPFVFAQMEHMRNHQGIVDLVNAYAAIALFHGLFGLVGYIGFQAIPFVRAWRAARHTRTSDPDLSLLGANLLACMLATVFFEITSGFMWMMFIFVGMLVAYAKLAAVPEVGTAMRPARMA